MSNEFPLDSLSMSYLGLKGPFHPRREAALDLTAYGTKDPQALQVVEATPSQDYLKELAAKLSYLDPESMFMCPLNPPYTSPFKKGELERVVQKLSLGPSSLSAPFLYDSEITRQSFTAGLFVCEFWLAQRDATPVY